MKFKRKIQAYSVIETLVSLLIISISFGITATLFVNISSSNKIHELDLTIKLRELSNVAIDNKLFYEDSNYYEFYTIKREIEEIGNQNIILKHIALENNTEKVLANWQIVCNTK